jgi:hypothetical protein
VDGALGFTGGFPVRCSAFFVGLASLISDDDESISSFQQGSLLDALGEWLCNHNGVLWISSGLDQHLDDRNICTLYEKSE